MTAVPLPGRGRAARRQRVRLVGLAAALLGAVAGRVLLGDYHVTIADLVRILAGADIPGASFIVLESKLPRALLGIVAGGALGVAGATFQMVLRNPLASPDIVGVSMGASAAAVIGMVTLGITGPALAPAATAGAVVVAVVSRLVAGGGGGQRVVLIGVGFASVLSSVVHYVLSRASSWDVHLALRWLTGSLSQASWPVIAWLTPAIAVLLALLRLWRSDLGALELGTDTARGLGVPRWRPDALLAVAVVMTALTVAAVGPLAFVAFIAGPVSRLFAPRSSLTSAGLVGAMVTVGADYVAAYLLAGSNLPVGVVTGAAGAPFLLWLLASGRTVGSSE